MEHWACMQNSCPGGSAVKACRESRAKPSGTRHAQTLPPSKHLKLIKQQENRKVWARCPETENMPLKISFGTLFHTTSYGAVEGKSPPCFIALVCSCRTSQEK
ncbi:hypothetical protein AV530_015953 [Patagioenas fasciata monilis]|uniref:Uncharacterized protein n=1 Tax=Patagioenas fasciata monilis TaxID=372326 RepID=A0A1V4KJI0_PATFA|nr:hypothetical protein AV530_015953 [Patagioenas fasciata monilis]